MKLNDSIIEANKPSFIQARFADRPVPENIKPILELLGAQAVAFELQGVLWWEITVNLEYGRVECDALGDDEDAWRDLIGRILDFSQSKRSK